MHRWLLLLSLASCAAETRINSYPQGAEVLVDGRPIGYTPAIYSDGAGWLWSRHLVTLYRDGYAPTTFEIGTTQPDYVRLVFGSLFWWPMLLSSSSYPDGYEVPLTPARR